MLQRLIILVATIAALSVSVGSREVSAAGHRAGLGAAGQLDRGGNAWHGAVTLEWAGTETARGTEAKALVAGPLAGDGARPM